MNCPSCGEVCRCHPEPPPSVHATELEESRLEAESPATTGVEENAPGQDPDAWRGELSARLDRYRARRKIRPPRYPSLNLQFGAVEQSPAHGSVTEQPQHPYDVVSDHALALNEMEPGPPVTGDVRAEAEPSSVPAPVVHAAVAQTTAKIIEFPRFAWAPPEPPDDQLAEPVRDVPRILDVPESAPPPPALGGITIEPVEREALERRPGIDIPLQGASLPRRVAASAFDWVVVLTAAALFGFIFWKISAVRPPKFQLIGLAVGIPAVLWFAYQYLFIVYGATTPGLRVAGLKLTRFDGSETSRSKRRSRVLVSLLSGISLGMGYAWVFLDEDVLCWHDRITHTYLAPVSKPAED